MSDDLPNIVWKAVYDGDDEQASYKTIDVMAALSDPANRETLRTWLIGAQVIEQVVVEFAAPPDPPASPDVLAALTIAIEDRRSDDAFMDRLHANMDKHADLLAKLAATEIAPVPLYRFTTTGDDPT